MVFHYHLQREELLIVLSGELELRTPAGTEVLGAGDVAAFPHGAAGAHGYANRTSASVRVLMLSEQNAPNVNVYPDANEIGIYDAAHPADRRFGARFSLGDARSGYAGGEPVV